jgi:hypothetical protein
LMVVNKGVAIIKSKGILLNSAGLASVILDIVWVCLI